jgi:hypothetical protein
MTNHVTSFETGGIIVATKFVTSANQRNKKGAAMFEKIRAAIVDDNEISKEWQRFASLALLLLAFLIAMLPYDRTNLFGIHRPFNFRPEFLSGTLAIMLIAPLYLRGLLKWNRSIFSTISFVLILGVFASFLELAVFGAKSMLGSINAYLVLIALALSWLGMRSVAGISWMLVLVAGVYNILNSSLNLGFPGFIYISAAFTGLCFHSGLNPGEFISAIKNEYSPAANRAKKRIADDVTAAGQLYQPSMAATSTRSTS